MAERTALMYAGVSGFGSGSKSLKGRKPALYPLKLYSLSKAIEADGDSLTWGVVSSLGIAGGPKTATRYSEAAAGYTYAWNANTGVFTVTDDTGAATVYSGIYTWRELGLSWGIIGGSQFSLIYMRTTNRDIFLIGARRDSGRPAQAQAAEFLYNDFLAAGEQHAVFDRLAAYSQQDGESGTIAAEEIVETLPATVGSPIDRTTLLAQTIDLQATGNYPLDLTVAAVPLSGERESVERTGVLDADASLLMIALFAQNRLNANAKVLYEPWMLWSAYRWYFVSYHSAAASRQIFDLSPRW